MEADGQQTVPDILWRFARLLGTDVKERRLEIPEKFGTGYCEGYVFNDQIRMLILHYELREDLIIENPGINTAARTILFKFQNVFTEAGTASIENTYRAAPSVLIATSSMNTDAVIPVHTNTAVINIEVDANYLNGLLGSSERSPVLQSLLQNAQPLLFEQLLNPSLQKIVDEIVTGSVDETFKLFYRKIKAEELICQLLIALKKRDEKHLYPVNIHDVQTIYKVREQMLEHLETPPVIDALAIRANMSPTKLKRLFKQIFGNSIFSYYQEFRMKEAAVLLKEGRLSVSDVGARLGFTNLSHFSKVFREHIGMKPKQYSQR
ncbi:helix-turn-helix domain-containing protein [Dawidia soli]|uniref:AraC family transcriptional regulator n=1 Tax=Dawidia soli TaxID=2782352 RepID=A0AAP2DIP3_9BACT|nr:AraC family transcriptional regulator [Dawidia soli]MBT1690102.1 AraC family transcriptional regulator [Dawidia soli]